MQVALAAGARGQLVQMHGATPRSPPRPYKTASARRHTAQAPRVT
jgi:hypothetical protein